MDTNVKINESDISVIIVKNENSLPIWMMECVSIRLGGQMYSFRWSNVSRRNFVSLHTLKCIIYLNIKKLMITDLKTSFLKSQWKIDLITCAKNINTF